MAPLRIFKQALKQLLFIVALMGISGLARAAEPTATKTNYVSFGKPGTLRITTPTDWTLLKTNLNLPDNSITFEIHAPKEASIMRFYVHWDNFSGTAIKPTEGQMGLIVSNNIVTQWMPVAVEKTFDLEKLRGPGVTGIFGRVTDSKWTPMVKDTYPNITDGMFRCANIWGNFNLLTHDKNGPEFNAGLKVLESMRRTP